MTEIMLLFVFRAALLPEGELPSRQQGIDRSVEVLRNDQPLDRTKVKARVDLQRRVRHELRRVRRRGRKRHRADFFGDLREPDFVIGRNFGAGFGPYVRTAFRLAQVR